MRILLAEDDDELARHLARSLKQVGHQIEAVADGDEALARGISGNFDVIVLDRAMPRLSGLEVTRRLRAFGITSPILMLTAKAGVSDRVEGLEAGADDYLTKPFAFTELVARIHALMRRLPMNEAALHLEVGGMKLDVLRREIFCLGKSLRLQPREFTLLEHLMRNTGQLMTRTMLLEVVWGIGFDPQTNIVETTLSRLRSKLRESLGLDPIETVRGSGYRMRLSA